MSFAFIFIFELFTITCSLLQQACQAENAWLRIPRTGDDRIARVVEAEERGPAMAQLLPGYLIPLPIRVSAMTHTHTQ